MEISRFDPCEEALVFRKKFGSFEDAWNECKRGDWMLWIASRLNVDLKTLTKAKALCALTVKHLMKDKRSLYACKIALKFSKGRATIDDLHAAAAAAADADADAAAYAAYAAADAADAAAAAAAYAAADADADAAAAAYAAYADAKKENREKTSDICREILTFQVFKKIKTLNN